MSVSFPVARVRHLRSTSGCRPPGVWSGRSTCRERVRQRGASPARRGPGAGGTWGGCREPRGLRRLEPCAGAAADSRCIIPGPNRLVTHGPHPRRHPRHAAPTSLRLRMHAAAAHPRLEAGEELQARMHLKAAAHPTLERREEPRPVSSPHAAPATASSPARPYQPARPRPLPGQALPSPRFLTPPRPRAAAAGREPDAWQGGVSDRVSGPVTVGMPGRYGWGCHGPATGSPQPWHEAAPQREVDSLDMDSGRRSTDGHTDVNQAPRPV